MTAEYRASDDVSPSRFRASRRMSAQFSPHAFSRFRATA